MHIYHDLSCIAGGCDRKNLSYRYKPFSLVHVCLHRFSVSAFSFFLPLWDNGLPLYHSDDSLRLLIYSSFSPSYTYVKVAESQILTIAKNSLSPHITRTSASWMEFLDAETLFSYIFTTGTRERQGWTFRSIMPSRVCDDCKGPLEFHEADGATICPVCCIIYEENAIVSSIEFNEGSGGGPSTVIGTYVGAQTTRVRKILGFLCHT